ncbi:MAG TPA: hypothetical protein VF576_01620 [Rubricoccaceae bacterium]
MPAQLFAKIDSWWKAGVIVGAIITASVTAGMTISGLLGLPAQVRALDERVTVVEEQTVKANHEAVQSRDAMMARLERIECIVVAGRRDTPIEDCL